MSVLLLWLMGYLTTKKRFSQHSPNHHLSGIQAVSTCLPLLQCAFLHTLGNFENVPVKRFKRLLQGEVFRDYSSPVTS